MRAIHAIRAGMPSLLLASLLSACGDHARGAGSASAQAVSSPPTASSGAAIASSSSAEPAAAPASSASAVPTAASLPGSTEGCADGMVRVEGDYCPAVIEKCKKHHKEYEHDKDNKNVSERCLVYEKPTKCFSKKKKHLVFCIDRYEYPNEVGQLPRVLTPWTEAKKTCEDEDKRLCTEEEFNFACEGPEMLPYSYGYERDTHAEICNVDREYRYPDHTHTMLTYDACQKDDRCSKELVRLDQREPIGQRKTCVSWAGVFDINGNVNEWVNLPKMKSPSRSGLKGGWWGPVRSRCRPTVGFHKEGDYGYEVGFRCCADTKK